MTMPEYKVYLSTPAEAFIKVEAEDPDDAIEKASDKLRVNLCHQCARQVDVGAGVWEPTAVFDEVSGELVWQDKP